MKSIGKLCFLNSFLRMDRNPSLVYTHLHTNHSLLQTSLPTRTGLTIRSQTVLIWELRIIRRWKGVWARQADHSICEWWATRCPYLPRFLKCVLAFFAKGILFLLRTTVPFADLLTDNWWGQRRSAVTRRRWWRSVVAWRRRSGVLLVGDDRWHRLQCSMRRWRCGSSSCRQAGYVLILDG